LFIGSAAEGSAVLRTIPGNVFRQGKSGVQGEPAPRTSQVEDRLNVRGTDVEAGAERCNVKCGIERTRGRRG